MNKKFIKSLAITLTALASLSSNAYGKILYQGTWDYKCTVSNTSYYGTVHTINDLLIAEGICFLDGGTFHVGAD